MRNIRKKRAFRPVGLDALEDRTVMSTGAAQPLSAVSALATTNQNVGQNNGNGSSNNDQTQQAASQIVNALVRQQFSQFAANYFAIEAQYFAHVNDSSTGIDYSTFQSQVKDQVKNLGTQVISSINSVPGGAGILQDFVFLRLMADQPGSLYYDLTHNLPPVNSDTGLTTAGFDKIAGTSIQAALLETQNLTNFYDNTLEFAVNNFFSGSYHFFNTGLYSQNLPSMIGTSTDTGTGSNGGSFLETVDNSIYQQFGQFSDQYYKALSTYLDSVKNNDSDNDNNSDNNDDNESSDIDTFRSTVTNLVQNLTSGVVGVINNVPGGAPYLAFFLQTRLGSDMPGSLLYNLTHIDPASNITPDESASDQTGSGLSPNSFALLANTEVQRGLTSSIIFVTLYDQTLSQVANGFFSQYSGQYIRGGGNNGAGQGGTVSAQAIGFGSTGTSIGSGQSFSPTAFTSNPFNGVGGTFNSGFTSNPFNGVGGAFNSGFALNPFNGTGGIFNSGFSFNPFNGFGGLGSGFNFGRGSLFGTGFGTGLNSTFGAGFGTGLGTGFGPGNTFGLFAGTGTLGTGTLGTGFGGFFF